MSGSRTKIGNLHNDSAIAIITLSTSNPILTFEMALTLLHVDLEMGHSIIVGHCEELVLTTLL